MCYSGCPHENRAGECTFTPGRNQSYPCTEFFCVECNEEISMIELRHNEGKCPFCEHDYREK